MEICGLTITMLIQYTVQYGMKYHHTASRWKQQSKLDIKLNGFKGSFLKKRYILHNDDNVQWHYKMIQYQNVIICTTAQIVFVFLIVPVQSKLINDDEDEDARQWFNKASWRKKKLIHLLVFSTWIHFHFLQKTHCSSKHFTPFWTIQTFNLSSAYQEVLCHKYVYIISNFGLVKADVWRFYLGVNLLINRALGLLFLLHCQQLDQGFDGHALQKGWEEQNIIQCKLLLTLAKDRNSITQSLHQSEMRRSHVDLH